MTFDIKTNRVIAYVGIEKIQNIPKNANLAVWLFVHKSHKITKEAFKKQLKGRSKNKIKEYFERNKLIISQKMAAIYFKKLKSPH